MNVYGHSPGGDAVDFQTLMQSIYNPSAWSFSTSTKVFTMNPPVGTVFKLVSGDEPIVQSDDDDDCGGAGDDENLCYQP